MTGRTDLLFLTLLGFMVLSSGIVWLSHQIDKGKHHDEQLSRWKIRQELIDIEKHRPTHLMNGATDD